MRKKKDDKSAKIRESLYARCETIARDRRKQTGNAVIWTQVMHEALELGLVVIDRRRKNITSSPE